MPRLKVLLFANTDWYLYNFRLPLARALRDVGFDVTMISPSGSYGAKLEAEGFRWIPLPMVRRSINPLREFSFLTHLIRLYRAERADIAHHFTIKCVVYGSVAAYFAGIPRRINAVAGMGYVFTSRGTLARILRPFVRGLIKLALGGKQSRVVLQNSDDCKAFEQARLVDRQRIRLIRSSGVNTERFRPRTSGLDRRREFRVIFAARLLWDKGVREYVEAARQLKSSGLPIEFLLAGSPDPGNPETVPEATVSEWKRAGFVTVLGHVDDMVHLLHQTDIAVLPSYREGSPKSLIEAAACGLPIITTDAPGCREVVDHGVSGILVRCRDAQAIAVAIKSIYDNPDEGMRMGIAGRQKMIREFDEKLVLRKTLDVYRELVQTGTFSWPEQR
jgi:glycosyltransferase involved in cell wall biosynthesis